MTLLLLLKKNVSPIPVKFDFIVFLQRILRKLCSFNSLVVRQVELSQFVKGMVNIQLESEQVDLIQKEIKEITYI
jgi:hypothetical protein